MITAMKSDEHLVTPELRHAVVKARTRLTFSQPFFAVAMMRMPAVFATFVPTAATDGRCIYLNPKFVALLSDSELQFLLCHEVMHVVARHADRLGPRDKKKWNAAADYAINSIIIECGLEMPGTALAKKLAAAGLPSDNPLAGLYNQQWAGMAAEAIYPLLPDPPPQNGGEGEGEGTGDILDPKSGPGAGDDAPQEVRDAPGMTAIDIHQASQAAKRVGKLPASLESLVGAATKPKVRWQEVLRQFLQPARDDYSLRRPNKRYASLGMYLPGADGVQCGPIAFGWDTSGSMHSDDIRQKAGSECTAIIQDVRPVITHVLYADTAVGRREDFLPDDPIVFKPVGGGGTDFRPVFDHIEEHDLRPECMVFFTDMYGTFPDKAPPYPVLWVSLSSGVKAPFGMVIEI